MCYTICSETQVKGVLIMIVKNTKKVITPTKKETPKRQMVSSDASITHEGDSMRGLFFIVKGQYSKAEPYFVNSVSGEVNYIGGYDPSNEETVNWYMLMDKMTFHCVSCGSDLDKVLKALHTIIIKHKGSAKRYFKHISSITSDDYYETHYLGHRPLTHDQRVKKAEGRCPRVSPMMKCLYSAIYSHYGDYYNDIIEDMEDTAYSDLERQIRENSPFNKTKKRVAKMKQVEKPIMETPKKKEITTSVKVVKPKVKLGMKKLSLE